MSKSIQNNISHIGRTANGVMTLHPATAVGTLPFGSAPTATTFTAFDGWDDIFEAFSSWVLITGTRLRQEVKNTTPTATSSLISLMVCSACFRGLTSYKSVQHFLIFMTFVPFRISI